MPDPTSTEPDAPQATPARETGPGGIETAGDSPECAGESYSPQKQHPGDSKGRAKAPPEPGSQPHPHPVREAFAQFLSRDKHGYEAYRLAKGKRVRYETAKVQASKWAQEPLITERVRWLRLHGPNRPKTPPKEPASLPANGAQDAPKSPRAPNRDDSAPITRAELVQKLGTLVRAGEFDASTITALLKLMPELTEGAKSGPDPADIVGHLASFAGRSGPDVVRELGGLPFLARRFAEVLRVSLADLAEACRTA